MAAETVTDGMSTAQGWGIFSHPCCHPVFVMEVLLAAVEDEILRPHKKRSDDGGNDD